MSEKSKENWKTTKINRKLEANIQQALKTKKVKEMGITNVASFVDISIKEMFKSLDLKRFEHLNMYEDHVKIIDGKLGRMGRIVSVYYSHERAWCDYCDLQDCIHVQYAWEIDGVREILGEKGLKPPPSRINL